MGFTLARESHQKRDPNTKVKDVHNGAPERCLLLFVASILAQIDDMDGCILVVCCVDG